MFPFGRSPYSSPFQSYDPYEEYRLQQELQRRRQAEDYARRRQLEELNRRRAEQLEYARRQAELQRRREAEARRSREMELEARRRKLSEPAHPRGLRFGRPELFDREPGQRHSMFDGGVQDLFDALYGTHSRPQLSTPFANSRRSASSNPRDRERSSSVEPKTKVRLMEDESAVSDIEEPSVTAPTSESIPIAVSSSTDATQDSEAEQIDTSPSRKAVADILSKFSTLKSEFTFPATLDFLPSPEGVSTPTPKLAYTPNNAPLHQYEHLLTGLLTQLDAVESNGDAGVRKARKDAVILIEKELEELDNQKLGEWRRKFAPPVSETVVIEPAVGPTPNVDPASVPLPDDEDRELHRAVTPQSHIVPSEPVASIDPIAQPPAPHHENREPHVEANVQALSTPAESQPTASPPSDPSPTFPPSSNAEPDRTTVTTQETSKQLSLTESSALEAGNPEPDIGEDEYVSLPSGANVHIVDEDTGRDTSEMEKDHDLKIKDDWDLDF